MHVLKVVFEFAGRFENRRLVAHRSVREQRAESIETDQAFADMIVTIAASAERHFGIVEVKHRDAVEPDLLVGLGEKAIDAALRIDLIPRGPRVRRIETNAELRVIERFDEAAEFFERAAGEIPGTRPSFP